MDEYFSDDIEYTELMDQFDKIVFDVENNIDLHITNINILIKIYKSTSRNKVSLVGLTAKMCIRTFLQVKFAIDYYDPFHHEESISNFVSDAIYNMAKKYVKLNCRNIDWTSTSDEEYDKHKEKIYRMQWLQKDLQSSFDEIRQLSNEYLRMRYSMIDFY